MAWWEPKLLFYLPCSSPPQWIDLPEDLTANILHRLDAIEIIESADKVCTTWRKVCHDPTMWKIVHIAKPMYNFMRGYSDEKPYEIICKRAIDLSQGELIELQITDFGSDELLQYICERSLKLKSLTLSTRLLTIKISTLSLLETIPKLPQLQELHLLHFPQYFVVECIELIAIFCPTLSALSVNLLTSSVRMGNNFAKAIAKYMPGLRRLGLDNCGMSNVGLEAILDACKDLEYLDIQYCDDVDLRGELGKRCRKQIKEVRHSGHHMEIFEANQARRNDVTSVTCPVGEVDEESMYDMDLVEFARSFGKTHLWSRKYI